MKLTNEQQVKIVNLREQGTSYAQISEIVLGTKTRKSTVARFLKKEGTVPQSVSNVSSPKGVRILFIDIETSPCVSYHWKRWDENIHQDQVIQESIILTFSAKFLGSDEVIYDYVTVDEIKNLDDKRVLQHIHDLLDRSDIVVAHNGKRFDKKKINTRLVYYGFKPTAPYKLYDTILSAKANFAFPSNSLDNICAYLGLNRKIKHQGFKLWREYLEGNPKAIQEMVDYNIQDVIILEEVYLKLRSWDGRHPNVTVYMDNKDACICCGSSDIELVEGELYTTNVSGFLVYECNACGKKFRGRKNVLDTKPPYTNIIG